VIDVYATQKDHYEYTYNLILEVNIYK